MKLDSCGGAELLFSTKPHPVTDAALNVQVNNGKNYISSGTHKKRMRDNPLAQMKINDRLGVIMVDSGVMKISCSTIL